MTLRAYLDALAGKKVAVLGVGVSNRPLLRLLAGSRASVTAYDRRDRAALSEVLEELNQLGIALSCGDGYLDGLAADVIFRTPGMRPDIPPVAAAVANGAVLTSEMEAFFEVCPCPIIAITGSDGKTTTSTLIAEMLSRAGVRCHLGGNIGRPLLADADKMSPEDVAVVELSSFQLMTMQKSASVAVVTNVAPNHLDVHRDMAEYVDAKRRVFVHQSPSDRVVLNFDNEITRGFIAEAKGRVVPFSMYPLEGDGVYRKDGAIWVSMNGKTEKVLELSDIFLPGLHNVENYMAAIAAVWGRVPVDAIRRTAREFHGVEHRIEFVRELHGVRYYNDSIATSPTRAIAGLRSFPEKVIMIAGGYDKHLSFAPLAPEVLAHVKTLVLCGATAGMIRAAVEAEPGFSADALPILETDDFLRAVDLAQQNAAPGDVVILCPACAAFDKFPNFMVRGKTFKDYVNSLPE